MESLHEAPRPSSFVPLPEHQSATPASFYTGPPVLHYYSDRCKVIVFENELGDAPVLAALARHGRTAPSTNGTIMNGSGSHEDEGEENTQKVIDDVDVWVSSDKLFMFCTSASVGVSIPYPSISLHAIQSLPQPTPGEQQGVYMQLVSMTDSSAADEDIEPESISITIVPTASAPPAAATVEDPAEDQPEQTPVLAMFTALSNCSNLHPDPIDPTEEPSLLQNSRLFQSGMITAGDAGGGLPPAMPGSGGWITAENMHEYVDDDGNWIDEQEEDGSEPLGPGAGTTRVREDEGEAADERIDGEETKWRRTT